MYRTGDSARVTPEGNIQILGRLDTQVKLKGYRVELDEVAEVITQHPLVKEAAAIVKDKVHLVGYFTPANVDIVELETFVAGMLPVYMVPSVWVGLDEMPISTNGKIDKKALEALKIDIFVDELESEPERRMAEIWATVLDVNIAEIGRNSSFFTLGGDSISALRVIAECARHGIASTVAELFKVSTLSRFAARTNSQADWTWPPVSVIQDVIDEIASTWSTALELTTFVIYPVTPLQAGMVYQTIQMPTAYVMHLPIALTDDVDAENAINAFLELVRRNEILRTTFVTTTKGIFQIIRQDTEFFEVNQVAVPSLDDFLESTYCRGFAIGDQCFCRLTILTTPSERYALVTMHHALYDGWSTSMIVSDFLSLLDGQDVTDRPPFRNVIDYIEAQNKEETESFWRTYLDGTTSHPLTLGKADTEECASSLSLVSSVSMNDLTALAKEYSSTVAVLAKLAWAATLRKYTRSNDVVFGQVMANRDIPVSGADRILGPLLSTVPCRVEFDDKSSLSNLVSMVQEQQGLLGSHSHASLVDIKKWCGVEGDLYDTLFVYQNLPDTPMEPEYEDDDNASIQYAVDHAFELIVEPNSTNLTIRCAFNPSNMTWRDARWILKEYDYTLRQMLISMEPTSELSVLWELSSLQNDVIISATRGIRSDLPFSLLHHAFEERSRSHPDFPAVEFEGQSLSYRELDTTANTLASRLVGLGVRCGCRVAVIMERCLEFPIGLLVVLKAGAAMMPLDAMFPATRLSYVLSDASAAAVITTEEYRYRIDELKLSIPVVYINAEDLATNPLVYSPSSENIASPEDEAYIVYTSGSTGKPKGVPVLHKGAVNTMMHGTIKFDLEGARMLQFFAIGFDGFQSDMWSALTQGATLVLRSDNNLDDLLSTIDMVTITPTGLSLLGDPDKYPRLRCVGVAGESVPTSLRDLWADKVHLINCYGPSEGSMGTHYETIYPGNAITIGNPFANVNAYVLDDLQRPVPIGVIGELYLGGVCVSPSYINLPEETATRFLADPFTGGRMFRTGDVARLLSNGKMEVLGRQDSQVKLKGYRIELDEVAEAMMQHPRVITAAAIVKSKTQLIGYFTPADVPTIELRQIVADILPTYMVPSIWVGLDSMPQNVNGKTDKKALEAMDIVLEVDTPETEEEKQMAQVWANVLNVRVDEIGRNSSFLALGGDSISAIKVVAACSALGVSLSAAQLFKGAVLSRVAEISTKLGCTIWPSVYLDKEVVDEITESWSKKLNLDNFIVYPATPLQAGMVYATMSNSSSYITQMPVALEENTTTDALITAFKQLVERHEILRTTFVTSTTGIVQVIRSDIVGLEVDISSLQLENFLSDDLARGFSLAKGLLF
ncbi:hypothetical protein AeMF1_008674 [Aphanomyces euteiches]|nr:hypothetical protein AeMF1_008674 [Aphanomyces euteiches]